MDLKKNFLKIFKDSDLFIHVLEKALIIILILVLASIGVKVFTYFADYVMTTQENANKRFGIKVNEKRSETLHKLVKSIIKYAIYFIAFFQILSTLGVNTTSIVASAGIASVAIGFGAQSLVKDIISGFFIILEGQFDVGDYVKIYNQSSFIAEGNVLVLGLRSTRIRSKGGEVYFIPNGSINQVINYSLTYNLAKVEMSIKVTDTIDSLLAEVNSLLASYNANENYQKLLYKTEKIKLENIESIEDNIATFKIDAKAKLGKKVELESLIRKDFFSEFKERLTSGESK